MQLIHQYLNSLEANLPEDQREEVRAELDSLITEQVEDKQEELGRQLTNNEIEAILKSFGHPIRVAAAYLPNQELVGQEYFPAYKKALEIALLIMLSICLISNIPYIFSDANFIQIIIAVSTDLFEAAVWVFAITTIVFYLMQKNNVSLDQIYDWSPKELNQRKPRLALNRIESLFELLVILIFLAWWNELYQWPSTINFGGSEYSIQFSTNWDKVFWLVNVVLSLSVVVTAHKILVAGWTKLTLITNLILNLVTLIILYLISQFDQFFVFEYIQKAIETKGITEEFEFSVYVILSIVALFVIWDSANNIKKLNQSK